MIEVVVDTNVILAANQQHDALSDECVNECICRLQAIMKSGVIVIDDQFLILKEYKNKTNHNTGKHAGDIFLKWALNNVRNTRHCNQVKITECAENKYHEFPDKKLQDEFDPPDRKFIAVAHAHAKKPTVLQAADCKWLNWNEQLKAVGISVDFVCPVDIRKFYYAKYPDHDIPDIT